MSQGTAEATVATANGGRSFTPVEKAVQRIIKNTDEAIENKGFRILAYPGLFERNFNLAIPDYSELRKIEKERRKDILEAVKQGYGAIIIRAESDGWDREYTRQVLIHHRRRLKKKDEELNGPANDKYRFDFLLDLLDWYRNEFDISPKICEPDPTVQTRTKRFKKMRWRTDRYLWSQWRLFRWRANWLGDSWETKTFVENPTLPQRISNWLNKKKSDGNVQTRIARMDNRTKRIVAYIGAIATLVTLASICEIPKREKVQACLNKYFGQVVANLSDKGNSNENRTGNNKVTLETISIQLQELIDHIKNPSTIDAFHNTGNASEILRNGGNSEQRSAMSSISDFINNILFFIKEFFDGLFPGLFVPPSERSTLLEKAKEWQTSANDWLTGITTQLAGGIVEVLNWFWTAFQSLVAHATGQASKTPGTTAGN